MSVLCKQLQEQFELMENKMKMSKANSAHTEDSQNDYDFASLKEKLRELVTMNVNWQKYSSRQEKTIQQQTEKIAQLERDLDLRSQGQMPESQQVQFDQLLLAKKHHCRALEEEKERTEDENHRMKQRLDHVQKSLDEQKERCALLETQLIMYHEDFKTERSDRERAQSTIIELEARLEAEKLRNEVTLPVQATTGYNLYEPFNHIYNTPLRGRGVYQTDGGSDEVSTSLPMKKTHEGSIGQLKSAVVLPTTSDYQTDGFDETDHARVIDLTEDLPSRHISLDNVLSCPKCRKAFTRDRHLELLEHMEECD